jgi:Ca2+-binding RTX toxin-like protein
MVRLLALAATAIIGCSLAIATASGDVSHRGWPRTVTVWFAGNGGNVGVGTNGNDMLLGGPRDDTIAGGAGDDILWGDRYPYPRNTAQQTDVLDGGAGNDWIYASHGANQIDAGPGNDRVFAYFGHGTIDCGPGVDVLTLSRTTQHAFTDTNCETVKIGYPTQPGAAQ